MWIGFYILAEVIYANVSQGHRQSLIGIFLDLNSGRIKYLASFVGGNFSQGFVASGKWTMLMLV